MESHHDQRNVPQTTTEQFNKDNKDTVSLVQQSCSLADQALSQNML